MRKPRTIKALADLIRPYLRCAEVGEWAGNIVPWMGSDYYMFYDKNGRWVEELEGYHEDYMPPCDDNGGWPDGGWLFLKEWLPPKGVDWLNKHNLVEWGQGFALHFYDLPNDLRQVVREAIEDFSSRNLRRERGGMFYLARPLGGQQWCFWGSIPVLIIK